MKPIVWLGIFALSVVGATAGLLLLSPDDALMTVEQPCDLHHDACVARDTAGHSIRFSLAPANIPVMEEVTARAELQGFQQVKAVRVRVEGVNMYMGYQFAELKPQDTSTLSGTFILPVCTLEKMQWKARVEVSTDQGIVAAEFPFETQSNIKLPPFPASLQ